MTTAFIALLALVVATTTSATTVGPPGHVAAWGANFQGQLDVPSWLDDATAISAGREHSVAVRSDGSVVAWGANWAGQTSVPPGLTNVVEIATGCYHTLALRSDGTVVAWGGGFNGESTVPIGLSEVTAVAAGCGHSLALREDGSVVAWGWNLAGQTSVPSGLGDVAGIAAGFYHSLALRDDGTVVGWGLNDAGEIDVPSGLTGVTAISAGSHSLALRGDGTVVAWGPNGDGQINVPPGLANVTSVAAGGYHSLAARSDGSVVAWGSNSVGQSTVPAGLTDVAAVAGSIFHSLAVHVLPDETRGTHDRWSGLSGLSGSAQCATEGWAFNPARPATDLTVRVLIDGVQVTTGLANEFRQDLLDAGIGDGTAAFDIDIAASMSSGVEHEVRVQAFDLATGTWVDLAETAKRLICTELYGNHDAQEGVVGKRECYATGWAFDSQTPTKRVQVRVRIDGKVVAETTADQLREDVRDAGYGDGYSGWTVSLLGRVKRGREVVITAEARDTQAKRLWFALWSTDKRLTCKSG